MVTSSAGLGPESDSAGKAQKELYEQVTDVPSRQRECPVTRNPQMSDNNKNLVKAPNGCLTPRQTGRLTVSRNITSTSMLRPNSFKIVHKINFVPHRKHITSPLQSSTG
jgi:hypothetical protein